jgi:hypothetical protein
MKQNFEANIFSNVENVIVDNGLITADVSLCNATLTVAVKKVMKVHSLMFTNINSIPFFAEALGCKISESLEKPKTVDDHFEYVRCEIAKLVKVGEISIACDLSSARGLFDKIIRILRSLATKPYIDWKGVGEQGFCVHSPISGWWGDDGFVQNKINAKCFTQSSLTPTERITIGKDNCMIWAQ